MKVKDVIRCLSEHDPEADVRSIEAVLSHYKSVTDDFQEWYMNRIPDTEEQPLVYNPLAMMYLQKVYASDAWDYQQKKIDALEERLRLAEEFIRKEQYQYSDFYNLEICVSCNSMEGHPCSPDCELQKILGKEKGEG